MTDGRLALHPTKYGTIVDLERQNDYHQTTPLRSLLCDISSESKLAVKIMSMQETNFPMCTL